MYILMIDNVCIIKNEYENGNEGNPNVRLKVRYHKSVR